MSETITGGRHIGDGVEDPHGAGLSGHDLAADHRGGGAAFDEHVWAKVFQQPRRHVLVENQHVVHARQRRQQRRPLALRTGYPSVAARWHRC